MKTVGVALVLAIFALFGVFIYRSHAVSQTDQRLCTVLYNLVARSGATIGRPGTPGYAYYHAHLDELRAARKQNTEFLRELDCHHLPTRGG